MVLSTTYDKDLKARVFMIRGRERYTNSTQTSLEVTYTANYRSHMTLNLIANTSRNVGNSTIAFYDNGELLGIVTCNEGDSDVALSASVIYGYHKIYAKYMGNNECLSSKSQIIELTVDEPDLPTPTLVFTPNNPSQWISSSTAIGGTVTLTGTNGVNNKVIKLFDGEEYVTSATTNSNGIATFSNQTQSVGVHNWRFVFEGDDGYLAAETAYHFASGFVITATPSNTSVVRSKYVSFEVNVQVPDFDYTDGSDDVEATIILSDGVSTHDSTTFIGTAYLTSQNLTSNKTFRIYDAANVNNKVTIPIYVIEVNTVVVFTERDIVSNGVSSEVTVYVTDMSNLPLENAPTQLYLDETFLAEGVTDENGEFKSIFAGQGTGLREAWAICGDTIAQSVTVYDMLQYINFSENISYNSNYTTKNNLSVVQRYNGLQLHSNNRSEGHIYFTYPNSREEDWTFEFKVNSVSKYGYMQVSGTTIQYDSLKTKPVIKVDVRNGEKNVYVNGTVVSTNALSQLFVPYLVIGANSEIVIDDIKLYRR